MTINLRMPNVPMTARPLRRT